MVDVTERQMRCTTLGTDSHVDHDLHSIQPIQLHVVALNERIKMDTLTTT